MGSPVRGLNRGSLRTPTCKHVRGHRRGKGAEAMRPEEQGDQRVGSHAAKNYCFKVGIKSARSSDATRSIMLRTGMNLLYVVVNFSPTELNHQ